LLPSITVRYCFRTLADATAFERRFLCVGKASCRRQQLIAGGRASGAVLRARGLQ
jgi:hypothetical protein